MQDLDTADSIAREGLSAVDGRERCRARADDLEDEVEQMKEIARVCMYACMHVWKWKLADEGDS